MNAEIEQKTDAVGNFELADRPLIIGRDGFGLPLEAVTQTFAFLAKRGVGKTYNSGVMIEEMLTAGAQVCVVDPVGVLWGLRLDQDGEPGGFDVLIFGGDHADLPLHADQGEALAMFLIDSRRSVILDLSHFRKYEMRRFMIAFSETLYRLNRSPLHIVLDEADAFAPQRTSGGGRGEDKDESEARLLGAIEDLVRRGRARGIGITMITQRPAVLNKNILTQIEVLVCLRLVAPQDVKAIGEWVEQHGTPEQYKHLVSSLPSLPIGQAWLWSPGWLDVFTLIQFRTKRTFDSSKTPKVGEQRQAPKDLKPINLDDLKTQFEAAIKEKADSDPKQLRARIKTLEAALETQAPAVDAALLQKALDGRFEDGRAAGYGEGYEVGVDRMNVVLLDVIKTALTDSAAKAEAARQEVLQSRESANAAARPAVAARAASPVAEETRAAVAKPEIAKETAKTEHTGSAESRVRVLSALISLLDIKAATRENVAIMAGSSPKSSTFGMMLADMKREGLIDYLNEQLIPLVGARNVAGVTKTAITLDALYAKRFAYYVSKLTKAQRRLVDLVVEKGRVSRDALAREGGASPTSSTYGQNIALLKRLGLIDYACGKIVVGKKIKR